jgi:hypothetical protein
MTLNTRILLVALFLCMAALPQAHAIAKIKLRKGFVDPQIRKLHNANQSNVISEQLQGEQGEKVDIINFMDAQVGFAKQSCLALGFSTLSPDSPPSLSNFFRLVFPSWLLFSYLSRN